MSSRKSVGIVGGGMMGVSLALQIAEEGYAVSLYEGANQLGGLATYEDFGPFTWDRFYHCILPTDHDLVDFLGDIGLGDAVRWAEAGTGVFIDNRIYPFNTVVDFALFKALSVWERGRLALTMLRCALVRDVRSLERISAREWFIKAGGEGPYQRIWLPLLRAKFGEKAEEVSPVFLVAKVQRMLLARKRSIAKGTLGYVSGGYKAVWSRCTELFEEKGIELQLETNVRSVLPEEGGGVRLTTDRAAQTHSRVILTTPFSLSRKLTAEWPGVNPVPQVASVDYMGIVCLILALRRRVTPHYVLNLADKGFPFTGVIGMTNLIPKEEVNGLELMYVPKYVVRNDPTFEATDREVFDEFFPHLKRLTEGLTQQDVSAWFVRRAAIVQPLQVVGYSAHAPQPDFRSGPVAIVNNAQLLETDLHNSMVIQHAKDAVRSMLEADANSAANADAGGDR